LGEVGGTVPSIFLTVDHVLTIHRRMVERFGGDAGLRDRGLLESAVAMSDARFGGEYVHRGIEEMAAACLFHLCKSRAFVDGNKRTALGAAAVFLSLNDCKLLVTDDELERLALGVAEGTISKQEVATFFGGHISKP
jgi:death on curing protein